MKKSVREKIMKMSEIFRNDSVQNVDQNVDLSIEDDHDQLFTFERSSLHDASDLIDIINRQIDLKKIRHQEINNSHTDMKTFLSFDRFQKMKNLHTDMKESQSFDRQSFHSFRASQLFQSAISTTKLFTLFREKRSLFESIRSLINTSNNSLINSSIRSNESRRHSAKDVLRVEIRSSQSRLMNQIDKISTEQISLEIIDIFERLNIANKIEKVREIVKEKNKAKEQFKSSKSLSSRSIESSDLNLANIIENKRNRKSNLKYAQLVYEE
jgi:hypothetical protein